MSLLTFGVSLPRSPAPPGGSEVGHGREDRSVRAAGARSCAGGRDLRGQARRRAARARARDRARHDPVQVVSRDARPRPGVPLAAPRPDRVGRGPIDLVITTKFPSYCVRHPNKRVWVLHQFRQAYDLDRTDLGQFSEEPSDRALRRSVQRLDRIALGEAKRLFATSRNVADRIERSTGLTPEVMPHPPQALPYRCEEYGDFVLSVNRLDRAKRIDLLLEAAALDPSLRVVVDGRRAGPGAARGARARTRSERARRVHRPHRRGRARFALRPLSGRLLRACRRGLRDGAVRGVPVREAGRSRRPTPAARSRLLPTAAPGSSPHRMPPRSRVRRVASASTRTRPAPTDGRDASSPRV